MRRYREAPGLLSYDEAQALIRERMSPMAGTEMLPLAEAQGRILAETVTAPRDMPAFANSAVDGFAFAKGGGPRLRIAGLVAAGAEPAPVLAGEAVRIFTGAPIPEGADSVVMQEDVTVDGETVVIPAGIARGAHIRPAGEDMRAGDVVVAAGARLRPPECAAIAATGADRVRVCIPLKVALISTGDEVVRPGTPLKPGQIHDANHQILLGLLRTVPAQAVDFGILADERAVVERAVSDAAERCDVILSSGGASSSEADHIADTMRSLGRLDAWRVKVKPGRPLAMGRVGRAVFFGLPGNPVSAFVAFLLFAQPMLARLAGADWRPPRRYWLPAGFEIEARKTGRRDYWRGWIEGEGAGAMVQKFPKDGSGLLSSLTRCDGLIEVLEDRLRIARGEPVGFIPFTEFGLPPR